jgi:hypothetical protein
MGTVLHLRKSDYRAEESNNLNGKVKVETVSRAFLAWSVGGEVTNRVTIKEPCSQRQCGCSWVRGEGDKWIGK